MCAFVKRRKEISRNCTTFAHIIDWSALLEESGFFRSLTLRKSGYRAKSLFAREMLTCVVLKCKVQPSADRCRTRHRAPQRDGVEFGWRDGILSLSLGGGCLSTPLTRTRLMFRAWVRLARADFAAAAVEGTESKSERAGRLPIQAASYTPTYNRGG
jgi:hypothetical protein